MSIIARRWMLAIGLYCAMTTINLSAGMQFATDPLPRNDRTPCTGLQKQSTAAAPRIAAGVLSLSASPPLRIIYIRLRLGSASCDSANSGPRDSGRATSL
jgi:hypothetical protein